jgi:hypothetical protein
VREAVCPRAASLRSATSFAAHYHERAALALGVEGAALALGETEAKVAVLGGPAGTRARGRNDLRRRGQRTKCQSHFAFFFVIWRFLVATNCAAATSWKRR